MPSSRKRRGSRRSRRTPRAGRRTPRAGRWKQRGGGLAAEGSQFPAALDVQLQGGRKAEGQLVARSITIPEPRVSWPRPEAGAAPYRTFFVADPDAPAKSWLHWLVVNCEGGDPDTGTEVLPWEAPNPGSGVHRYFFCLYQHGAPISVDDIRPAQRGYWNWTGFVEANGLVPVAAAMIQVRAERRG